MINTNWNSIEPLSIRHAHWPAWIVVLTLVMTSELSVLFSANLKLTQINALQKGLMASCVYDRSTDRVLKMFSSVCCVVGQ